MTCDCSSAQNRRAATMTRFSLELLFFSKKHNISTFAFFLFFCWATCNFFLIFLSALDRYQKKPPLPSSQKEDFIHVRT